MALLPHSLFPLIFLPCCVYIPAVLFKVPFEYSSKYLRLAAAFVLHDTRHTLLWLSHLWPPFRPPRWPPPLPPDDVDDDDEEEDQARLVAEMARPSSSAPTAWRAPRNAAPICSSSSAILHSPPSPPPAMVGVSGASVGLVVVVVGGGAS
jgi:hypothetical protein